MSVRSRKFISGFISLFLVLLLMSAFSLAAWQTEAVYAPKHFESFSRYALALDTAGHPHLVYGGDHLYHAYHDGLQWHYETVDSSSGVGKYAAVDLDAAGNLHIGYFDSINKCLKYATNASGSWETENASSIGGTGPEMLMHVDSSGSIHMMYSAAFAGLRHISNTSGTWVEETVGESTPAFTIDHDGNLHTVTCDSYEGCNTLQYNTNVSGEWETKTIGVLEFGGGLSSLTIASDGKAHLIYYKNTSESSWPRQLMYAANSSGTWIHETVDGDNNFHSSTVVTSSGDVHISYHYNDGTTKQLRYAFRTAGTWTNEIVETRSTYVSRSSLDVDPSGNVHIAYAAGDPAAYSSSVLHAVRRSDQWSTETVDTDAAPFSGSSIAVDSSGKQHVLFLDETNATLHYATNVTGTWSSESIVTIGKYYWYHASLALDISGKAHISYYDDSNDAIQYATNRSGEWMIATIAAGQDFGYSSIAVDAQGAVYIAYYESNIDDTWNIENSMYIASNTDGMWKTEAVGSGSFPVLAAGEAGSVHVAYVNSNMLKYGRYTEGSFVTETADNTVHVYDVYGISIDPSGSAHILYNENRLIPCPFLCPPHSNLRYAANVSGQWSATSVEDCSNNAFGGSLAVDGAGTVHAVYATSEGLRYVNNSSGPWLIEAVDGSQQAGTRPSMVLDSFGKAHISYYDGVNHDLMHATNMHSSPAPLPAPDGRSFFSYNTADRPLIHHEDPGWAQPLYSCFDFVDSDVPDIRVGLALDRFTEAVDIYGAYRTTFDPGTVFFLNADLSFSPKSLDEVLKARDEGAGIEDVSPWMSDVTQAYRLNAFTIPLSGLGSGTYWLYLLVTPAGMPDRYYLWQSFFVIP